MQAQDVVMKMVFPLKKKLHTYIPMGLVNCFIHTRFKSHSQFEKKLSMLKLNATGSLTVEEQEVVMNATKKSRRGK